MAASVVPRPSVEVSTFTLDDLNRTISLLPWPQPITTPADQRTMRDRLIHQAVAEWRKRQRASCLEAIALAELVTQAVQLYVANHVECPVRNRALAMMAHGRIILGDLRFDGDRVPSLHSLFSDREDYVASPPEVDLAKYREAAPTATSAA